MNNPHVRINPALDDWALTLAVVFVTFLASIGTKTLLKRIRGDSRWKFLHPLAPSISALVYLFGLKILIDVTPLSQKVLSVFGHVDYVLTVILFLNLVRHSGLIVIEWTASRVSSSRTLHQGFIPLFRNLVTLFVFFSGSIMILKRFNYDVMSLMTALGVGSLAVGLAAKETLSNMISGFTLIIDRNLKPGDRLNLAGMVGDVEEIGLRSTRIFLGDGNTLIVPNAELVNTKILNLTMPSGDTLCTTRFRISYEVPFEKVKPICESLLEQHPEILQRKEPAVLLSGLEQGQTVTLLFWIADPSRESSILSEIHEKLLRLFHQAGIRLRD